MEIPDEIIKEIRESGYDQDLLYIYTKKLLDRDKEYDELSNFYRRFIDAFIRFRSICCL